MAQINGTFDRRREAGGPLAKRKDVLFIDASREFQPAKTQNILLEEHIAKIVDTFKSRANVEKYSRLVAVNEIEKNDFNLNSLFRPQVRLHRAVFCPHDDGDHRVSGWRDTGYRP